MRLRQAVYIVLTLLGVSALRAAEESGGLRLEVVAKVVHCRGIRGEKDYDAIEITSFVKNTGTRELTVPTSSYSGHPDVTGGGVKDQVAFFTIGSFVVEGRVVQPSPCKFAPVVLEPGESAALPIYEAYGDVSAVETVRVSYDVEKAYAQKHRWWSGSLDVKQEIEK